MAMFPDLNGKTRDGSWQILNEWVRNPGLIRHCLAVETAMRAYATRFGESEDAWGLVGLLHDFDYERYPDLAKHPFVGATVLRDHGYPEWFIHAVLSHAGTDEYPRRSNLEKGLFAVDELTGFISAVALVRPSRAVSDVTPATVRKKMKDRRFAEAIHREELTRGAAELGVDFDEHVEFVVRAMSANASALGLAGVHAPDASNANGA